jgi:hypothetical protein
MSWQKKILNKYKKEIIESATVSVLVTAGFSLWYYSQGKSFVWTEIDQISIPGIPSRLFYSALVFVTIGAFLLRIGFYKLIADFFGRLLGDWELYHKIKHLLWSSLTCLMCFYIVPKVVGALNAIASFFYNIWFLILYLVPAVGIFVCIALLYFIIKKRKKYANF